jgi:hypothetical protein
VLVWSAVIAWMTLAGRGLRPRADTGVWRGLLLGLGLVSLIGMPTQDPVVLVWFFALAALLAAGRPATASAVPPGRLRAGWVVVAVLAVAYAAAHAALATTSLSVEARALRASRDHAVGLFAPEPDPEGGQFRWTAQHAELLLAPRTRWLVLRTWVAHPDVTEAPVGVRLATPCQVLLDEQLRDSTPVDLALVWPGGPTSLQIRIDVSRTWSPSGDEGNDDSRVLGAALETAFVDSDEEATAAAGRRVTLEPCGS